MCDLQKASMWKRASAFLFDVILLGMVAVGIALLLSMALGYDAQIEKLDSAYAAYEEKYNINIEEIEKNYDSLSEEEKAAHLEIVKALNEEISADTEIANTNFILFNLTLIIATFGILISYILLEIIVPLLFKNGQTLGKKAFGVAVMRVDGVKLSPLQLFIRTIFGKFTIETMFPIFMIILIYFQVLGIVGTAVILMLLILQIVVISVTKTNSAIHDLIAGTVTVDMASQLIFDSPEALMEYKKRVHAEAAEKAQY